MAIESKTNVKPSPNAKNTKAPAGTKAKGGKPKANHEKDVRTISIVKKENPHKAGSKRAKAFDAVLKTKTVGEYSALGAPCKFKYLKSWEKAGLIKLSSKE
jgi:hypothetical protein